MKTKKSLQFEEEKLLIELESEAFEMKHKLRMEELLFRRETNRIFCEEQKSVHRLKRADRNRDIAWRESRRMSEQYEKK